MPRMIPESVVRRYLESRTNDSIELHALKTADTKENAWLSTAWTNATGVNRERLRIITEWKFARQVLKLDESKALEYIEKSKDWNAL